MSVNHSEFFAPLENREFRDIFDMCRDQLHMKVKYTQDLYLIKYMRDRGANLDIDFVRHCRGTIFEKGSNPPKPVCYPLSGGVNYEDFKKFIPFERVRFEESIDGTMINVFYFKDFDKMNFMEKKIFKIVNTNK